MSDAGERTEKASDRRLREAHRKGRISRSQDLTAWLGIAAAALAMPAAVSAGASAGTEHLIALTAVIGSPDPGDALAILGDALADVLPLLAPILVAVFLVTLAGSVVQGGVRLRGVPARFEQFDVVAGLRRLFGLQSLWEGAKTLLKTAAIGAALWIVVAGLVPVLMASGSHPLAHLVEVAASGVAALIQAAVAVGIALAVVDVLVVRRRNTKHTRMTKREARDESKSTDGDPHVRQHRRSRQLAMSRNRMIAAVAGSDVVVVNPTHVAVALRYEPGKAAPRVVAKGAGVIADRIRERATEAGVPLVRDVPLARALHAACEPGQEIPADLYTGVARVLVFVDALQRRGAARGTHSLPPRRAA